MSTNTRSETSVSEETRAKYAKAVAEYTRVEASDATHTQALNELMIGVHQGKVPLVLLVELDGEALTSTDSLHRGRGMMLLGELLNRLPELKLNDDEFAYIAEFFNARLLDSVCHSEALLGIHALFQHHSDKLSNDQVEKFLRTIFAEVNVVGLLQSTRVRAVEIFQCTLDKHLSVAQAMGSDFVFGVLQAVDGEKDPRILIRSFPLLRQTVQSVDGWTMFAEDLFDACACYFPLQFKTSPSDPQDAQLSQNALSESNLACLAATPVFAQYAVPFFLQKLAAGSPDVKRSAYEALVYCVGEYGVAARDHLEDIWAVLRSETLSGRDTQLVDAAIETVGRLVATLARDFVSRSDGNETTIRNASKENLSSLEVFLRPLVMQCVSSLHTPDSKLAHECMRILEMAARSSPIAARIELEAALPELIRQYEEHTNHTDEDDATHRRHCHSLQSLIGRLCVALNESLDGFSGPMSNVSSHKSNKTKAKHVDVNHPIVKHSTQLFKICIDEMNTHLTPTGDDATKRAVLDGSGHVPFVDSLGALLCCLPEASTSVDTVRTVVDGLTRLSLRDGVVGEKDSLDVMTTHSLRALRECALKSSVCRAALARRALPRFLAAVESAIRETAENHRLKVRLSDFLSVASAHSALALSFVGDAVPSLVATATNDSGETDGRNVLLAHTHLYSLRRLCEASLSPRTKSGVENTPAHLLPLVLVPVIVWFTSLAVSSLSGDALATLVVNDASVVEETARLIGRIVESVGAEAQTRIVTYTQRLVLKLELETLVKWQAASGVSDAQVSAAVINTPISEDRRAELRLRLLPILVGVVGAVRRSGSDQLSIENIDDMLALFRETLSVDTGATVGDAVAFETSLCVASLLNKGFVKPDGISDSLVAMLDDSLLDQSLRARAVARLALIGKAKFMCGQDGSGEAEALVGRLNDEAYGPAVARGIELIVSDIDRALSKSSHAQARLLYKQRAFSVLIDGTLEQFNRALKENFALSSYVDIVDHFFRNLRQSVVLGRIEAVLPMLLRTLDATSRTQRRSTVDLFLRLIVHSPESITSHLFTLVPALIELTADIESANVRRSALRCLTALARKQPFQRLFPFRKQVLHGLETPLGDDRREVRRHAALCANVWEMLS